MTDIQALETELRLLREEHVKLRERIAVLESKHAAPFLGMNWKPQPYSDQYAPSLHTGAQQPQPQWVTMPNYNPHISGTIKPSL